MLVSRSRRLALAVSFALGGVSSAVAAYEIPNAAYAAPSSYYTNATGTGSTLRSNLYTIINKGFVHLSYDSIRSEFVNLDPDPAKPGNILLMYDRTSVNGTWDSGVTYNREHIWAKSRLSSTDRESDYFNLRPANPRTNSGHGNENYASYDTTGAAQPVTLSGVTYWFPGDVEKGEVARVMFYMATKWNMNVVNGNPAANNDNTIGDLNTFLHWHYQAGVDNFERRRNQVIYTDYQHNRNPYVDHPEYVWAVFGTHTVSGQVVNDSQLSVSTPAANGSSSKDINLGRILKSASFTSTSFTLSKSGADPTTCDITTSGSLTTSAAGTGQGIDFGTVNRTIAAALSGSTATPGTQSGTITIHNSDLTSTAAGHGAQDADDIVTIHGDVLDHAAPSFSATAAQTTLSLHFDNLAQGSGTVMQSFQIFDLISTVSYTAALDLDSISSSGDTTRLNANLAAFNNLAPGSAMQFTAAVDTSTTGSFVTTYTLNLSDENLPGATATAPLTLNLVASVVAVPEPSALALVGITGWLFARRPQRRSYVG